ncbi:MAG: hypothetical protein WCI51_02310 [Lentisphaerota bacterium]
MTLPERLKAVADALKNIKNPDFRTSAITGLFGKSGMTLAPFLNKGGSGIKELMGRAEELGVVMGEEDAAAAAKLHDALMDVETSSRSLGMAIGKALMVPAREFLQHVIETSTALRHFIDQNQDLVQWTAGLAIGLSATGAALLACSMGAKILSGALVVMANPAILGIASAVAGLYLLNQALKSSDEYTAKLIDTQSKKRQQDDEQRKLDQARLERLRQLNSLDSLSADQQLEAQSIIDKLNSSYGELGLSLDSTTGRVEGLTQAQEKLNEVMSQRVIRQLKIEIQEHQNNIDALGREKEAQMGYGKNRLWTQLSGEQSDAMNRYASADEKQITERQKMMELQRRVKEAEAGNIGAITGRNTNTEPTPAPTEDIIGFEKYSKSKDDLLKIEEKLSEVQKSRMEREIDDIQKLHKEQRDLLTTMIKYEKQMEQTNPSKYDPVKITQLERRLAEAAATESSRIAKVKDDAINELNKSWQKQQDEESQSQQYKAEDRAVEKASKQSPALGIKMLETMWQKAAAIAESAKQKVDSVMQESKADGIITEDEKKNIDDAQKNYKDMFGRRDSIEEKLYGAKQGLENAVQTKSIGGFSGEFLSQQSQTYYSQSLEIMKSLRDDVHDVYNLLQDQENGNETTPLFT